MKSLSTTHAHTQFSTPCGQLIDSDEQCLPALHDSHPSQNKMIEFMATTMSSITNLLRATSVNRLKKPKKPSKPSISIMPLTREKVRVGQRGWKISESRQALEGLRSSKASSPLMKGGAQPTRSKKYIQFFTMLAFMYNKSKKSSYKLQVLIDELIIYFSERKQRQYLREIDQIASMAGALRGGLLQGTQRMPYELIKNCDGQLSKLFYNICYEIYLYRHNQFTFLQLSIIHRDIEYYSRRLGMLDLTLVSCMDMGRVCLDFYQFQRAAENYSKALKLSVFMGDQYREQASIDKLGMCEYYRGDMMTASYYHSSVGRLSAYNKVKIRQHYSNQKEIQKILEEKTKEKSHDEEVKEEFFRLNKESAEFNFDTSVKDFQYTQNNYDVFRGNLKEMIKINSLRKKVPLIKVNLQKVRKIGDKKYKGKDYFVPKACKFHNSNSERSQDEFMITHRSFNRNNVSYQSGKIDKHCKIIDQVINFFVTDYKNNGKVIRQQRESMASDQTS